MPKVPEMHALNASEMALRPVLLAVALVSAAGKLGDAFAPELLRRGRVFLLLLLNSSDTHLLLTAGSGCHLYAWLAVALARRLSEDCAYYFCGRSHGPEVVAVLESVGGMRLDLGSASRWWGRLAEVALAIFPSGPLCVLVGVNGTSPARFICADGVATLVRMALIYSGGAVWLGHWTGAARALLARHPVASLALSVAIAAPGTLVAVRLAARAIRSGERGEGGADA